MVQYGIWIFDEKVGLIGRPENFPEIFLGTDKIWEIKETRMGPVWKWPVQFAELGWFTPRIADNFNKAFFFAQKYFEGFRPKDTPEKLDLDTRTLQVQTEILSDHFRGTDEELSVRK